VVKPLRGCFRLPVFLGNFDSPSDAIKVDHETRLARQADPAKLEEGCTIRESAAEVGITRQAVLKRKNSSPGLAQAIAVAREAGNF